MLTRRRFISTAAATGAGLILAPSFSRQVFAQDAVAERNKRVVLGYQEAMQSRPRAEVEKEVMGPGYRRTRMSLQNLANNAEGQGFPANGDNFRTSFPDRRDIVEEVIAEGDTVGVLSRVTGTHSAPLYGIAATGRKVNFYEAGIFRLAQGKIVEAWFLGDEAGLLKQLGAKIPARKDGRRIVPPLTTAGDDPDAVIKRLEAGPLSRPEDRNRLMVARSKGSAPLAADRGSDLKQLRFGFQHLRDYGIAKKVADQSITAALPDRRDRIDGLLAEGEKVWMMFKVSGTQTAPLYGLPPTGRRVELPEIGVMTIVDGKWKQAWYFGDELGMMLQLDALHMLEA